MGYITTYNGQIKFDNKNEALIMILKRIKELSGNCQYVSSSSPKGHYDWFHKCDRWIAYSCLIDVIDFNKGELNAEMTDFKDYEEATINLVYLISLLDPTATGKLKWSGEDVEDHGTICLNVGKKKGVWVKATKKPIYHVLSQAKPLKFGSEKDTKYVEEKQDFFGFINFIKKKDGKVTDQLIKNWIMMNKI